MKVRYDDLDNRFATTLNGGINSSATVINLSNVPPNASEGFLAIDADNSSLIEYIYFESKGAGFVTCPATGGRGQGGTTARTHDDGAIVKMYLMREHVVPLLENAKTGWIEKGGTMPTVSSTIAKKTTLNLSGANDFLEKGTKVKITSGAGTTTHWVVASTSTNFTVSSPTTAPSGSVTAFFYSHADMPKGFFQAPTEKPAYYFVKRDFSSQQNTNTTTWESLWGMGSFSDGCAITPQKTGRVKISLLLPMTRSGRAYLVDVRLVYSIDGGSTQYSTFQKSVMESDFSERLFEKFLDVNPGQELRVYFQWRITGGTDNGHIPAYANRVLILEEIT